MDLMKACEIVEGDEPELMLEAWAYLIKTGHCWNLQGWYGRHAQELIEEEIISPSGEIIGESHFTFISNKGIIIG